MNPGRIPPVLDSHLHVVPSPPNKLAEEKKVEQFVEGLTDYQRAFLRKYPYPQLFYVVSWGCAATAWLATILNRHPDIYCVHAANLHWHVLGECEKLDGARYLRVIGSQGHAHVAAGGVHGMSRHLVPECRRMFGDKFNSAVVVREPISRLRSHGGPVSTTLKSAASWTPTTWTPSCPARASQCAPEDYRSRLFVHAANMLNAILDEGEVGKIYRCEDLTSNCQVLGEFVEEITRGKVSPDSAWLESAIHTKKVNVHAGQHAAPRVRRLADRRGPKSGGPAGLGTVRISRVRPS